MDLILLWELHPELPEYWPLYLVVQGVCQYKNIQCYENLVSFNVNHYWPMSIAHRLIKHSCSNLFKGIMIYNPKIAKNKYIIPRTTKEISEI